MLDLRDNGGGLLNEAVLISSIFIPEGKIVTTKGRSRPEHVFEATGGAISTKIPVVVLVNGESASASEIVTGALQDRDRANVVGTRTFGKGVFQEIEQLSNGGALDITVGEYFLPSGRNLGGGGPKKGAGITPDVKAQDDDKTKRDEALDVAVRTARARARVSDERHGGRSSPCSRSAAASSPRPRSSRAGAASTSTSRRARCARATSCSCARRAAAAATARSCGGSGGPTSRATCSRR